jgi:hypothetical protein
LDKGAGEFNMPKFSARVLSTLTVFALLFPLHAAHAAIVNCPGTLITTDREFSLTTSVAATCLAFAAGNINGNNDAVNQLGYLTVDKTDNTTLYIGIDGELQVIPASNGLSGTFNINPPVGYQNFVLVLKSGVADLNPDWAAFLLPAGVLSGSWTISGQNAFSHANLYAVEGVAQTPLPGALWLMGSVLAGWFGFARLRQKGSHLPA